MGGGAVWWKGSQFDARTRDMLVEAERLCGLDLEPSQGSWSSASASAGTHSGCGAYDGCIGYSTAQQDNAVDALRRVGFAAWRRTSAQGFTPHVHAIAVQPGGKHDRGCLSAPAHDQVASYYEGRNGLASNAPDDGPRAYVGTTWESYRTGGSPPPPTGGGDDDMTPEQATLLGNIGWAVDQIRSTDLPPIRSGTDRVVKVQDSTDKTEWGVLDEAQGLRTMVADLAKAVARIEDKLDGAS